MNNTDRRSRLLTDEDLLHLRELLHEPGCCSVEEHNEQHEILSRWIENDNTRRERSEKRKESLLGWFLISVLGGLGTAAWNGILYLKDHLK